MVPDSRGGREATPISCRLRWFSASPTTAMLRTYCSGKNGDCRHGPIGVICG